MPENAIWSPGYYSPLESHGRWMAVGLGYQNFDRKLGVGNSSFCACAVQIWLKSPIDLNAHRLPKSLSWIICQISNNSAVHCIAGFCWNVIRWWPRNSSAEPLARRRAAFSVALHRHCHQSRPNVLGGPGPARLMGPLSSQWTTCRGGGRSTLYQRIRQYTFRSQSGSDMMPIYDLRNGA